MKTDFAGLVLTVGQARALLDHIAYAEFLCMRTCTYCGADGAREIEVPYGSSGEVAYERTCERCEHRFGEFRYI